MTKGQRLRTKRELLGISQTDLANRVGISKQTLYKYENDIITNIPSDIIELLAHNLDCSPAYIMGWEDAAVVSAFTRKFAALPRDLQENVMQYMDFLIQKKEKQDGTVEEV